MRICFTKSQLTDFYNKAVGGVKPEIPLIKGEGELKIRGLALGVEQKAIEAKLTKSFGDLPDYRTVNLKEQAQKSADLLNTDYEKAKRVAMGQETPPTDLLPEMVFNAVEERALREGDITTLKDLGTTSELLSEATTMGQRIRALGERNPESPVAKIIEVVKAREKQSGIADVGKAKSQEAVKIKNEIAKVKIPKETWDSFISSLVC